MKPKFILSAIMILCSSLILSAAQMPPQVKKSPHLYLNSLERMKPNGEYVISVWKDGRFEEAGRLACDRFVREQELDLSPYLAGTDTAKIKITERGPGAAHIDSVLLGGKPPGAVEGREACRILRKLSTKDNDIIDARGQSFELMFDGQTVDKTLRLAARIESEKIGTAAFQFPTDNLFTRISPHSKFYTYALNASTPPQGQVGSDDYVRTVGRRHPIFQAYAPTSSGHPAGTTYGWVSNDEKNLYVTLDFTPDNTYDGDKDYAQVHVNTGREVKEFRVSVSETKWGTSHFIYTDKVAYEHKVYDFVIPLSELDAPAEGGEVQLAFAAYGTAAIAMRSPSLAFDPDHKRYLLVCEVFLGSGFEILGLLLDMQGYLIEAEGGGIVPICGADNDQVFPDVAYDSAFDRFLVVWQDGREESMCYDIYGQMVNWDGSLYGDNFVIATDDLCQYRPAVADDSNQNQFLVVWYQDYSEGTGYDILGQLVGGNGNLIPPASITTHIQSSANGINNFIVSDALGDQSRPDVAFDGLANEYLVVFQSQVNVTEAARKQALDALPVFSAINGQFITWEGVPQLSGTDVNFLISDPAYDAVSAAVANDNIRHRFLVAWADYPSNLIVASQAQGSRRTPGALGSRWMERARTIHPNHKTLLSQSTLKSYGTWATPGRARPQALQQDDEGQPFIYGQLVGTGGNLIYDSRFLISEDSEDLPDWLYLNENNPAVAFDSYHQNYLVIFYVFWWDMDYDESGVEVGEKLVNAAGEQASDYDYVDEWYGYPPAPDLSPDVAFDSVCRNFFTVWPTPDGGLNGAVYGPEVCVILPEVLTTAITDITPTSAKSGGNVISDGGGAVTARGVCWNTSGHPTTSDSLTSNGSGLGSFPSQLTGLNPNTKYYVRAYATNSVGTAYGNELTFTTLRQFKVTFVAGPGGTVSGTLVQYVAEGGNCTPVEAQADTGSCFIIWTGTTGFTSTSANPLTVTNVLQDMTITANFGKLALVVQKLTEKAWIIKRFYGKIVLSVDGLDPAVPITYVLNRKQTGGEYKSIKEFTSSELQNNTFTYEDKFLEANITYVYQVVAYNSSNQVIGRSQEITVQ